MKKSKKAERDDVTPEEALAFIESVRQMIEDRDEPTIPVSIRVPGNILRAVKIKAKSEGKKYQSLMIQMLRDGLKRRS